MILTATHLWELRIIIPAPFGIIIVNLQVHFWRLLLVVFIAFAAVGRPRLRRPRLRRRLVRRRFIKRLRTGLSAVPAMDLNADLAQGRSSEKRTRPYLYPMQDICLVGVQAALRTKHRLSEAGNASPQSGVAADASSVCRRGLAFQDTVEIFAAVL